MTERCLDHLLTLMPTVIARAENEWARNFAKSIIRQSRRTSWQPSPKQLAIMRSLVSDLFREAEDFEVIEEETEWP